LLVHGALDVAGKAGGIKGYPTSLRGRRRRPKQSRPQIRALAERDCFGVLAHASQ
jgi:hypothetical protein